MNKTIVGLGLAGAALAALVAPPGAHAGTPAVARPEAGFSEASPLLPLLPASQQARMFTLDLPVPIFYTPDTTTFPGFDYYEIDMSPVEQLPVAFPQPPAGSEAPAPGEQWLGLVGADGRALYTPLWGYGQWNMGGGLLGAVMGRPVATYPAMSFKATKGRPVKVKWINHAPDWHLLCPWPQDLTQPCAIDRTLMGTKLAPGEQPNPYGSLMQPDNAMVVHLHGGEIPPDSDGFAELWLGNATTAAAYDAAGLYPTPKTTLRTDPATGQPTLESNLNPPFHLPAGNAVPDDAAYASMVLGFDLPGSIDPAVVPTYQLGQLTRPTGDSVFYNYPMVQDAATIWYHDHALGKTRINVVAGPAGYFYVTDPVREKTLGLPAAGDCSNNGILNGWCYDIPIVFQDRAFNADGTINFPNGLGQAQPPAGRKMPQPTPLAPGPNPTIHPQWVPEYFGDIAVVNGVIWPRLAVEPRPYRFRFLDGSNARCYTFGLSAPKARCAPPRFVHIANEQGYLPAAVTTAGFSMCPGEREEVVIDFSGLAGTSVFVTNTAGAPFPLGITPQMPGSPYAFLARLMRFDVVLPLTTSPPAGSDPLLTAADFAPTWNPAAFSGGAIAPLPRAGTDPISGLPVVTREKILNEVLDPVTAAPLRVQIDGKAFEDLVTETPRRGSVEVWKFINTTVDAHPIHLHLVQFQVVSRQGFANRAFTRDAGIANLAFGGTLAEPVPPIALYTAKFAIRGPNAWETGWKDTVIALPGEVTTVVARWDGRWADQPTMIPDPDPLAPPGSTIVDPTRPYWEPVTAGPYVWHCHIVDHEDNEMMRPSLVIP